MKAPSFKSLEINPRKAIKSIQLGIIKGLKIFCALLDDSIVFHLICAFNTGCFYPFSRYPQVFLLFKGLEYFKDIMLVTNEFKFIIIELQIALKGSFISFL